MDYIKSSTKTAGDEESISETVREIIGEVKKNRDKAIFQLTRRFDGVEIENFRISRTAITEAYEMVSSETIENLRFAAQQIKHFAARQLSCLKPLEYESIPGVTLGHRLIPVSSCGAYIPSGRYPLPSTALMSIIPAKVAGVKRVAACSPPTRAYSGIHPAVLVAMDIAGADEVYCMGGAQAVAAYAYGTTTVLQVDLIVGPGNKYVTEAKRQLSGSVGIDLLAGPSEVLIIADESASPKFIAMDLLAKCEHDPSSLAILVTTSRIVADQVIHTIEQELQSLETAELAAHTWKENGQVILVDSLDEAVKVSDKVAPEHLQLQTTCNDELVTKLHNFGSLFIGNYAPVAFGDYVSGPNHTLPTMGCARFSNGVWVGTFIRVASYQKVTKQGAVHLAGPCSHLAGIEGLIAHQKSADIRRS